MTAEKQNMIEEQRYARQKLIWGEEGQTKLNNSRASIVGMDKCGIYTALCMAALGVGNISLIGSESVEKNEGFLGVPLNRGEPRVSAYGEVLKQVNKQINIEAYASDLESRIDQDLLLGSDVVIETTNSPASKERSIVYCWQKGIPVISASSMWGYSKAMLCDSSTKDPAYLMPMFEGRGQDTLMALLNCGVITEEARKILFGEKDQFLKEPVRYSILGKRFGHPKQETPAPSPELFRKLNLAFLGGGALGCWAAIAMSDLGFGRVDVYDYDVFDSTNINRQVLGFDGVGSLKAPHIAGKIRAMSGGRTESEGFNVKILPGFKTERKYDLVFDFVDNPYTRALNTAFAIVNDIPMVSSGALPYSARSISQVRGKTRCLNCIYDIYEAGRKDEMIRRASCAANPNPSVVMANAIGGAMAIADMLYVFESDKFGQPFNGELTYRATNPKRFGTNQLTGACNCYDEKPIPELNITDDDVKKFAEAHPEALREAR